MTAPRDRALRGLLAAGIIELITLAVLFINLASGNNRGIAAAFGPIHGTAYLIGVILGWRSPLARWRKIITIVPGVGTLIATGWRRLRRPWHRAASTRAVRVLPVAELALNGPEGGELCNNRP